MQAQAERTLAKRVGLRRRSSSWGQWGRAEHSEAEVAGVAQDERPSVMSSRSSEYSSTSLKIG